MKPLRALFNELELNEIAVAVGTGIALALHLMSC